MMADFSTCGLNATYEPDSGGEEIATCEEAIAVVQNVFQEDEP